MSTHIRLFAGLAFCLIRIVGRRLVFEDRKWEYFRMQRLTCGCNRTHSRMGTLWKERFKSVIVKIGVAARTMTAYSDLNPVRAYMCQESADFEAERWTDVSWIYRRVMGLALGQKSGWAEMKSRGRLLTRNTADLLESIDNETVLPDLGMAM